MNYKIKELEESFCQEEMIAFLLELDIIEHNVSYNYIIKGKHIPEYDIVNYDLSEIDGVRLKIKDRECDKVFNAYTLDEDYCENAAEYTYKEFNFCVWCLLTELKEDNKIEYETIETYIIGDKILTKYEILEYDLSECAKWIEKV
jgi:hypothetical protein